MRAQCAHVLRVTGTDRRLVAERTKCGHVPYLAAALLHLRYRPDFPAALWGGRTRAGSFYVSTNKTLAKALTGPERPDSPKVMMCRFVDDGKNGT